MLLRALCAAVALAAAHAQGPFRFGGALESPNGDGVVLQAERPSMVWGFVDAGATVSVTFAGKTFPAEVGVSGAGLPNATTWRASLPAMPPSFQVYNISAASGNETISINGGAMFGDVWVCSGQSNMAYPLGKKGCWDAHNTDCHDPSEAQCKYGCVNNSDAEVAALPAYDDGIRAFIMAGASSSVPTEATTGTGWHKPSGLNYQLSATCWFFGRAVYAKLAESPATKRPIGLIGTYVGGTPDEHWSSPDALAKCEGSDPWDHPRNFTDSVLWNGMVVPLLHTVIKGAVWYQGERNSHSDGRQYACTFPAMIADWRAKFHQYTDGNTDPDFPFGWVQLNSDGSPAGNYANNTVVPPGPNASGPFDQWAPGFPSLRLAQTATLSAANNTFQAVIVDTPIASGSVHSPWKQPVGARLARGGLAVAYGMRELHVVDPVVETVAVVDGGVRAQLTRLGPKGVLASEGGLGFEILGAGPGGSQVWYNAPITAVDTNGGVTFGPLPAQPAAVRYLQYTSPCGLTPYECAVYTDVDPLNPTLSGADQDFLPLAPFVMALPAVVTGRVSE